MFNFRIINGPTRETMAMLKRRMHTDLRKQLENRRFNSVGLVQADLPDLFYFADVGQKAGSITAIELNGSCPQHISTVALFGDIDAVKAAINAIKNARNANEK